MPTKRCLLLSLVVFLVVFSMWLAGVFSSTNIQGMYTRGQQVVMDPPAPASRRAATLKKNSKGFAKVAEEYHALRQKKTAAVPSEEGTSLLPPPPPPVSTTGEPTTPPLTETSSTPIPTPVPPVAFHEKKEQQLIGELKTLAEMWDEPTSDTDRSSGRSRVGGYLYRVHQGNVKRIQFAPLHSGLQPRAESFSVKQVELALRSNVVPQLKDDQALYFHMGLEDHDPWYHVRMNPKGELAEKVRNLSAATPNLFWVHWNPTLVDEENGHIGRNVIPVPDFEADQNLGGVTKHYLDRTKGIAWRGVSTGFAKPYTASDRYRVVQAFENVPDANVKFSGAVQGVSIPGSMKSSGLDRGPFSNYQVVLDIDGNANAWTGFHWKLAHGCTVLKVQSRFYIQWYYPLLEQGRQLWVSDVDHVVEQASLLSKNKDWCNTLSDQARRFANKYLSPAGARNAFQDAFQDLSKYTTPSDWRIRGSAGGLKRIDEKTEQLSEPSEEDKLEAIQRDLVGTIQRLDGLRSKGSAGGSRLAGELLFADGKGNAHQVTVFRDAGGRQHNPIQPLFLEGLRKLSKPAFVHFGYEDHCPWYHVRFDPNCELSKGIVALTKKYPMFFWAHWNPTIVNEATGQIGTRMVPIPHFETQQKDDGGDLHLPPWRECKNGVCWRGTTTGYCNPYSKCDRYKVVKAFQGVQSASVKFYSICQNVPHELIPDSWMSGSISKAEFSAYKVTVDVDGNANAWEGLRWKLRAGSVVVKAHSRYFAQWYYPELEHGRHLWLSDVEDVVTDSLKLARNETLCDEIGKSARDFGEKHLSTAAAREASVRAGENLLSFGEDRALSKDWRPRR